MYSTVLMMAISTSAPTPGHFLFGGGCNGCNGYGGGGSCHGRVWNGGCQGGCRGGGWGGGCNGGYRASGPYYPAYRAAYYVEPSRPTQAVVNVTLPAPDARIWFDDSPTEQQGMERRFVTPDLDAGRNFTYTVKASWMENGREVTSEKKVEVRAGQEASINFGTAVAGRESLDTKPLPTHTGKIVRLGNGQLVMTDLRGNSQHSHRVAADAQVFIQGKKGLIGDLKPGMEVTVTTDRDLATRIEAKSSADPSEKSEPPPQ